MPLLMQRNHVQTCLGMLSESRMHLPGYIGKGRLLNNLFISYPSQQSHSTTPTSTPILITSKHTIMAYHKVAIAGATGNVGPAIVKGLVDGGFAVTALSRSGKTDGLPSSVKTVRVNYDSQDSLVQALKGHDAFISAIPKHGKQAPLHRRCHCCRRKTLPTLRLRLRHSRQRQHRRPSSLRRKGGHC